MRKKKERKGLVQVYTGNGKGKTTAALGLALRAAGHGLKVYIVQFMKTGEGYGETNMIRKIENIEIKSFGRPTFVNPENPAREDIELARKALSHAQKIIASNKYDMVILDEANVAVKWDLIKIEDLLETIKNKPEKVEVVLTGRYAPKELIETADLVTEMKMIKHPYSKGISNRKGIDY